MADTPSTGPEFGPNGAVLNGPQMTERMRSRILDAPFWARRPWVFLVWAGVVGLAWVAFKFAPPSVQSVMFLLYSLALLPFILDAVCVVAIFCVVRCVWFWASTLWRLANARNGRWLPLRKGFGVHAGACLSLLAAAQFALPYFSTGLQTLAFRRRLVAAALVCCVISLAFWLMARNREAAPTP
ncbi:MAG: hypothetical protein GC155_12340 [Alphaproteobacteria bacterium]|nr:hypothetical protein [Alphaproteobacteria bacterium]